MTFRTGLQLIFLLFGFIEIHAEIRIVGGDLTTIDKVPYIVNIRRDATLVCGGTLVSTKHVVTAAHCVYGYKPIQFQIVAKATFASTKGLRSRVEDIIIPDKYDNETHDWDVAVMKLKTPITDTDVKILPLCKSPVKTGTFVQVSGWGRTHHDNEDTSKQLQTMIVSTISDDKCKNYYGESLVTDSMFCAAIPGKKDSCKGDSGGPLVFNGQLCGIVSWGIGCADPKYPGIYTNVLKVKSFIENAIAKN